MCASKLDLDVKSMIVCYKVVREQAMMETTVYMSSQSGKLWVK